jgi:hypothetical protein
MTKLTTMQAKVIAKRTRGFGGLGYTTTAFDKWIYDRFPFGAIYFSFAVTIPWRAE